MGGWIWLSCEPFHIYLWLQKPCYRHEESSREEVIQETCSVDVHVLFWWCVEETSTLAFDGILSPREATLWSFDKELGPQKPPDDFLTHLTCSLSGQVSQPLCASVSLSVSMEMKIMRSASKAIFLLNKVICMEHSKQSKHSICGICCYCSLTTEFWAVGKQCITATQRHFEEREKKRSI